MACLIASLTSGASPQPGLVFRKGFTGATNSLAHRQTGTRQIADTVDRGDSYSAIGGKKRLFRLAGSIVIRLRPQARDSGLIERLTAENGVLPGYHQEVELAPNVFLLRASALESQQQRLEPERLQQVLEKARRANGIQSADPVFVEPETGLACITTREILLRLESEIDPQRYFDQHRFNARPLRGTRDQFILTFPELTAEKLLDEVNRLAAQPEVSWAAPNFHSQVVKESSDPLFAHQWPLRNSGLNGGTVGADVNAPGAWTNATGSPEIVIAILDDGVQLGHPDLSGNIFTNPGETSDGLDNDGNGYVDDLHGWDFYRDDNDPNPEMENDLHGTATAGVAAAVANNNIGLAGIAYGCRILPLKVMTGSAWASDSALAEALYYAAGRTRDGSGSWRGADVISIGLSFPKSPAVDAALLWASTEGRRGKGCAIFAAAGDDASRWRPTQIRLPLGVLEQAGDYQFGFEYSKDVSSSDGEDLIRIDNVALLASDGVTQLDSALGLSGRQDFEGIFPPSGWRLTTSRGAASWVAATNGALTGTRGKVSAQSGPITNNQWTELRTPVLRLTGSEILTFSCYLSTEADFDGLKVWIYEDDDYVTVLEGPFGSPLVSGNPPLGDSIHYPANQAGSIAVGASTDCDVRADYSQTGLGLEFLAPSSGGWNDIITTDRTGTNGYTTGDYRFDFGGTSAACPLAAGIGALVLSLNPKLTVFELRALLRNGCDKIGEKPYDSLGWNSSYGFGRLNAQRAVSAAEATTLVAPFRVEITNPAGTSRFTNPASLVIEASAAALGAEITRVEFFDGTNKIGAAATAPYLISWGSPPNGLHPVSATAIDEHGREAHSGVILIDVVPAVSITDGAVMEDADGNPVARFTVKLSGPSDRLATADFALTDNAAETEREEIATNGMLTFPAGTITGNILVPVAGDAVNQSDWTLLLTLSNPLNAGLENSSYELTHETVTNRQVLIGGKVRYYPESSSGDPTIKGVPGVALSLSGGADESTLSATDGAFGLTPRAAGSFYLTPTFLYSGLPAAGVTTFDISIIRRHILDVTRLDSPYKLLAADVNGSKSVTTLDISWIRKVILDATNAFPAGLWRGVPSDYVFPDPEHPWDAPSNRAYTNLLGNRIGQDFIAIKLGDVNSSWTAPSATPALTVQKRTKTLTAGPANGPDVVFQIGRSTNSPGETVAAQIKVRGFRYVTSLQFTLGWDAAVLAYKSTGDYGLAALSQGNFGTRSAKQGQLSFSWDIEQGATLPDDTAIFTVYFQVIGNSGTSSPLELVDTPAEREVAINFTPAPFREQNGQVTVGTERDF